MLKEFMKYIFSILFAILLILSSCDKKATDVIFDWQDISGDYIGEFKYSIEGEKRDYWFIVDRKVSFFKLPDDTFKIIINDTTYNAVDFHLTTSDPFLDTTFRKDIHLEYLDLDFFEVPVVENVEEGTLRGNLRITNKDYQEYSSIMGIEYFNDQGRSESLHMILERFLPIGSDLPDSIESVSFHAYR